MREILIVLLIFSGFTVASQSYVGEILVPGGYEYMKVLLKEDSLIASFPYEFRRSFGFQIKAKKGSHFVTEGRAESRTFEILDLRSDEIQLSTSFTGFLQIIRLQKQRDPLSETEREVFEGNYVDKNGNRAIVYSRRGYLHLMSPYEEQTVSLKPVGEYEFWSVSGESSKFSDYSGGLLQKLSITNRFGTQIQLNRSFDYKVTEDWVLVDGDSIYVNLFIPNVPGKKAACLLLPGGGGMSQMENFEFEARFFAAYGMVAMTFDKSSVGKSTGVSFENYTFKQKARRYEQLFHYLQLHVEVDPEKVGIHGPSEGGRLALMMGINLGTEVAFINATAAPIMTSMEGQLYAANHYSRNLGMTEEEIVTTLYIWKSYYNGIIEGDIDTTQFAVIRDLRVKYRRAFLPPASNIIPLSPKKEDLVDESVVSGASKLTAPVFLQYGENDQRVDPMGSLQNFYGNISDTQDVTAEIYPRGNHSMMTPEREICSGYAYDKMKWLRKIGILQ